MMDTLSTAQALEAAGFDTKQAIVIAQLLGRHDSVATKEFVHTEISNIRSELKEDIANIRSELANLSNKMLITAIGLTSVIIASIKLL